MEAIKVIFDEIVMKSGNHFSLTPVHAYAVLQAGQAVLLDIRTEELQRYKQFKVPRVYYLQNGQLSQLVEKLPKDKIIIVADTSSNKVEPVLEFLQANGFTLICSLAGGMLEWERDGLPVNIFPEHAIHDKHNS